MSTNSLIELINKPIRRTLGLMSGTSADGLDIALCEVNIEERRLRNVASMTMDYPDELRAAILEIAHSGAVSLKELIALSNYIGWFYTQAVADFMVATDTDRATIDLVGAHGQTIAHLAKSSQYINRKVRGTLQIGECEYLAKKLGLVTVSDFRSADIAVGGSGAPLVPIYHSLRFADAAFNRVVINIGGIANATVLTTDGAVIASDVGPGNCLLDTFSRRALDTRFDHNGELAQQGRVDDLLLERLQMHPALQQMPPLSLDRGDLTRMLDSPPIASQLAQLPPADVLATLCEYGVRFIHRSTRALFGERTLDELIICGGGAHNQALMTRLEQAFAPARLTTTSEFGSHIDFVEAEAFAFLANLTLSQQSGNLPQVTGASRPVVLGKISLP